MKITEVQERYGLKSRQSAYDRVNALKEKGIELSSDSLDKLDEHLKLGGTLSDFADVAIWREPDLGGTQIAPLPKELAPIPQNQQETLLTIGEMTRLMEAIAQLRISLWLLATFPPSFRVFLVKPYTALDLPILKLPCVSRRCRLVNKLYDVRPITHNIS